MEVLGRLRALLRRIFRREAGASREMPERTGEKLLPRAEEWAERVWTAFSRKLDDELPGTVRHALKQSLSPEVLESLRAGMDGSAGPSDAAGETSSFERPLRTDFAVYALEKVKELRANKRCNTAASLYTALKSLQRFWGGGGAIPFERLTISRLRAYQEWLVAEGVGLNTVSCYMRSLRSAYNQAVAEELVWDRHPFRPVYSKVHETNKRAIPALYLQKLKNLPLSEEEGKLALVRDLFLFSFYSRGMSFIDMAYLRGEQLKDGFLVYRRHKTHQEIRIKLERCMEEIIGRYASPERAYVFPILTSADELESHRQYRSRECYYNRLLKELGGRIGLQVPLTFYVARHTWASLAFRNRTDLGVISKALGHTSLKTTLIYIKSIESDRDLHDANRNLIRMVAK